MNNLPTLCVLVSSLAIGSSGNLPVHASPNYQRAQAVQRYSLDEVHKLLEQRGQPLLFSAPGELVWVRYAPPTKTILIHAMSAASEDKLQERSLEEPLMTRLGISNKDLLITSEGNVYGDNEIDVFSPSGEPIRQGYQISPADKGTFLKYLHYIGTLLSK